MASIPIVPNHSIQHLCDAQWPQHCRILASAELMMSPMNEPCHLSKNLFDQFEVKLPENQTFPWSMQFCLSLDISLTVLWCHNFESQCSVKLQHLTFQLLRLVLIPVCFLNQNPLQSPGSTSTADCTAVFNQFPCVSIINDSFLGPSTPEVTTTCFQLTGLLLATCHSCSRTFFSNCMFWSSDSGLKCNLTTLSLQS